MLHMILTHPRILAWFHNRDADARCALATTTAFLPTRTVIPNIMPTDTCMVCGGRTHDYEEISTLHGETRYWFCSDEHKEEFEQTPEHFA